MDTAQNILGKPKRQLAPKPVRDVNHRASQAKYFAEKRHGNGTCTRVSNGTWNSLVEYGMEVVSDRDGRVSLASVAIAHFVADPKFSAKFGGMFGGTGSPRIAEVRRHSTLAEKVSAAIQSIFRKHDRSLPAPLLDDLVELYENGVRTPVLGLTPPKRRSLWVPKDTAAKLEPIATKLATRKAAGYEPTGRRPAIGQVINWIVSSRVFGERLTSLRTNRRTVRSDSLKSTNLRSTSVSSAAVTDLPISTEVAQNCPADKAPINCGPPILGSVHNCT